MRFHEQSKSSTCRALSCPVGSHDWTTRAGRVNKDRAEWRGDGKEGKSTGEKEYGACGGDLHHRCLGDDWAFVWSVGKKGGVVHDTRLGLHPGPPGLKALCCGRAPCPYCVSLPVHVNRKNPVVTATWWRSWSLLLMLSWVSSTVSQNLDLRHSTPKYAYYSYPVR
jgi:hypothetical protein